MLISLKEMVGHDSGGKNDDDIQLLEGDVIVGIEDGIPSIRFLDRIHQLLYKSISRTIVVKLSGRKIRYHAQSNIIYSLWKLSTSITIMDLENDYFMVMFQSEVYYIQALTEGLWIVYGTV